ncbi:MAG: hypothetical protein LUE17_11995 [Planctomycetaceae bacterium]|nr:hypothetical protein [Planctomycetaceae bacterium]
MAIGEKRVVILGVIPVFLNQQDAGHYLGHCGDWLRKKAKEPDLFKPSAGEAKQGVQAKYHIEHLDLIALHMVAPEILTMDAGLKRRERWKMNNLQNNDRPARRQRRACAN